MTVNKFIGPLPAEGNAYKGTGGAKKGSSVLDDANYAQKTYGNKFSEKGIKNIQS